jgi:hypothetical protein
MPGRKINQGSREGMMLGVAGCGGKPIAAATWEVEAGRS